MLEAAQYEDNAYLTLTYSNQHLPRLDLSMSGDALRTMGDTSATLVPEHLRNWLKRFRKAIEPSRIRYYAVGEYGDETFRPHYHVALFGYPTCEFGRTRRLGRNTELGARCCAVCSLVHSTWGMGGVDLGHLEEHSAQYVAGYVTKKMTRSDDPRLQGRHPEFCRMSLRPGIGFSALHEVASEVMRLDLDSSQADVPVSLRHGHSEKPLGRYLVQNLRKMVGKDAKAPPETIAKAQAKVFDVRVSAFNASRSFKEALVEANAPKVARLEAREKIFRQRKDKL